MWRRTFVDEMMNRCFASFTVGRCGEAGGAVSRSSTIATRSVRRHPDGGEEGIARRHFHAGDPRCRRQARWRLRRESSRGWVTAWRAVQAIRSAASRFRSGGSEPRGRCAGGRRRHHGDARQLEPSRTIAAWEIPSWRQLSTSGSGTTRAWRCRPDIGPHDEPYYFDQTEGWTRGQYRTQPFSARRGDRRRTSPAHSSP